MFKMGCKKAIKNQINHDQNYIDYIDYGFYKSGLSDKLLFFKMYKKTNNNLEAFTRSCDSHSRNLRSERIFKIGW